MAGLLTTQRLQNIALRPIATGRLVEAAAIGCLLAFAFVLRAYDLGVPSLWMDEAITAEAAKGVLAHGVPILPSDEPYHRGLLNTYLVAASFKLFGVTELAGRLPSVLFGTATVLTVYWLGTAIGGRRVGLIAATIMTFSTLDIAWSRQARMYAQLEFFVWASLLAAHLFVQRMTWRRGAVLALLTVAAVLSHEFAIILPLLLLVFFLLSSPGVGRLLSAELPGRVIAFAAILPALAAVVLTMLKLRIIDMGRVIQTEANYSGQYYRVLDEELGLVLYMAVAGVFVLSIRRWRTGLFLLLTAVLPFYALSFHVFLFASRYIHFFMPAFALAAAFWPDFLVRAYQRYAGADDGPRRSLVPDALLAALLLVALVASEQFTFSPRAHYDLGYRAPQPAFKEAAAIVRTRFKEGDVVVAAWTPLAQFYLGRVDYWFAFDVAGLGIDYNIAKDTGREIYTGAEPLFSSADIEAVHREHPRGWVVIDDIVWEGMSQDGRDFLNNNLSRLHGESFRSVLVWSWGTGA